MNTLLTLVKMQLAEKLNFKRVSISKSALFNTSLSALVALLKFLFVTAICYAFILIAKVFSIFRYS